MIELRTLGTLDLRNGQELRSILAQPKRTGFLCYLALARPHGFHRRDKLLALFWPETDSEHGRASLRQAVRFLRRSLGGEAVIQSRGDEELALAEDVLACDARAFEAALAAGEPERALGLYGGDLLPGFYVEGAPEFERWLESERTRLRERAVAGAWALAEACERAHDGAGAAEWGRRASAMAPADEAGLRRVLLLLERLGDVAGALAAYNAGVRRLRLEFEVEPSRETRELGEELCERLRLAAAAPPTASAAPGNGGSAGSRAAGSAASLVPATAEPVVGRRRRRAAWLSLAAGVVALGGAAGGWLLLRGRSQPRLQPGRVVVAPFENRTGDAALALLGDMATDWITQGLTESGSVEVADASAGRALARQTGGPAGDGARALARAAGSAIVVAGRYYRQADSLAFLAQVLDGRSGRVLVAVGPVAALPNAPAAALDELRGRVVSELAVLLQTGVPARALGFRAPKYEAYREFMEGRYRAEVRNEIGEAAGNYLRAYQLDTTFHHALVAASYAALMHGPRARYDSLQPILARVRDRLSPGDLRGLEWQRAYRMFDYAAMYALAQDAARRAPGSDNGRFGLAIAAGRVHRYRESVALFRRVDPDRPLSPRFHWAYLGGAQHVLGDYRGQLRSAEEMARRSPESVTPDAMRLAAHAALGHTAEVRRLALVLATRAVRDTMSFQEIGNMEMLGAPPRTPPVSFFLAARELAAHDHGAAARAVVDDGLRWCAARSPAERADTTFRWVHAQLLALAGRWREADAVLPAAPPRGWNPPLQWSRALLAVQRGDRVGALEISRGLGDSPRPLLEFQRVTILAALGEREEARTRLRELLAGGGFFGEWWVHTEPVLAPYLRDPELRRLLRADG